ncbi:MAG TPA: CcmD family protein [Bacteroidetes bacterium]|nr:CcmD family protein [Bacteroidota bacterium]
MTLLGSLTLQAQDVEMATGLRASGKIYVVVAVLVTIFAGITIYLVALDKRIRRLEKEKKS